VRQRLLTAGGAKAIDRKLKDKYGISTLVLMENAGKAVASAALKLLKKYRSKSVAVFCGKGNNGGDGFVAARHLLTKGVDVDVFLLGNARELKNEAKINYEILKKLGYRISQLQNNQQLTDLKKKIRKYGLIVDALLGVGLDREVRGLTRKAIEILNSSKVSILAIDIPSGLDATSGMALGCAIRAVKTVTFIAAKKGLVTKEGSLYSGKVEVYDLGVPL
jgi:NAD(P)H-hydrate epimerase